MQAALLSPVRLYSVRLHMTAIQFRRITDYILITASRREAMQIPLTLRKGNKYSGLLEDMRVILKIIQRVALASRC